MKYSLIAAICLFAQPAAAQALTVAQALEIKDRAFAADAFAGRAEWNALTFYLQGAVEAAVTYQKAQQSNGSQPLFCPPQNHSQSMEDLFAMLDDAKGLKRQMSAVEMILETYAKKYPCKK